MKKPEGYDEFMENLKEMKREISAREINDAFAEAVAEYMHKAGDPMIGLLVMMHVAAIQTIAMHKLFPEMNKEKAAVGAAT